MAVSEQRLFDALATLSRAFAEGGAPAVPGAPDAPVGLVGAGGGSPIPPSVGPSPALAAMDDEARTVLGEAALAVAFGALASDNRPGGAFQVLLAAMGLMAVESGEEPDPPAEILATAAEDAAVEAEVDRAGDWVDAEWGRDADGARIAAALEARILGSAITLAGCTLPPGAQRPTQAEVRLRAARVLARLSAGLLAMNAAAVEQAPPRG